MYDFRLMDTTNVTSQDERNMRYYLMAEGVGIFAVATGLYFHWGGTWLVYALLFFAPDLAFLGYAVSTRVGSVAYNITHHQGLAGLCIVVGMIAGMNTVIHAGCIMLAHSAFDRMLGYGLKYPDAFKHTHLGWIGR